MLPEILFNVPSTAHCIGGCVIADSGTHGVVDSHHRVFNYKNMYICDGSVVAANLGVNPSLTITALAERAMSFIHQRRTPLGTIQALVLDHVEGGMKNGNSHFDSVCIKSTGSYVPSKILTNEEVMANLPDSPEWVVEKLGIRERHIAEPDEYTSDLAARAGLDAIASAGLEPNEIDLIIVSTATPDRKMPSSACIAQNKMGIRNRCAAFDVAAVCAGFVYGTPSPANSSRMVCMSVRW